MTALVDPSVLAHSAKRDDDDDNLAFLPNLVPTYRTEEDVGLFSLFHEEPKVEHGWRLMLRGLHLPKLLVCKKTIDFLETCAKTGGVDWKPLPPEDTRGSSGIVFNASAFDVAESLQKAMHTLSLEDQKSTDSESQSDGEGD